MSSVHFSVPWFGHVSSTLPREASRQTTSATLRPTMVHALRNALEHAVTREAATRPIGPAVIR
ncbi:hypothetical protein [Propioniciclava sp.]|uniref:hypothetical protein n=1 Tax=Propioniciclava sp. TaxID=2038686 RepID=UPI00260C7C04|nr:hypothetical protein [Propioniciclava sp.]